MRRVRKQVNHWLTRQLNLPADVIYDYPRITLIGDIHLYIENHHGLLTFESNEIKVKQQNSVIHVRGQDLVIKNLLKKEIVIEGKIDSIHREMLNG
ncbi:sporulation protein YqfC [Tenuibacillus multivorans]|uniref:Sporulation protein YqfC n=1 Tax=Tenuibacillus multivorans TaxID=237069 RepID=A0A1G9ZFS2_9BACI|nr:sporulation protein YqfC [Tenuibacillus multivorans]GEL78317.1 sporulation protein YqfC [Tenuibacillus multivorans]SDN19303.1 sporulation protein YqfC [Tenuibacillus multivorans]